MIKMFCLPFTHKYGKVENRYQYCEKCGKARLVKCNHKWDHVENVQFDLDVLSTKVIRVLRCENCGEMKNFKIK
jgi:transcription elongation factor Elf1